MLYLKSIAVLLVIIGAEIINGICRGKFLTPRFGDFRARQISVLTGSLNIFLISLFCIRWISPTSQRQLLEIGAIWLVLMLAFEMSLGRIVFKLPWGIILEDFNLFHGRLLALGMIYLALAPFFAAHLLGTVGW